MQTNLTCIMQNNTFAMWHHGVDNIWFDLNLMPAFCLCGLLGVVAVGCS